MKKLPANLTFILLMALPIAVYIIPDCNELLEYNRNLIEAGEFWRLITGHITHFSFDHLFWDSIMFAVVGSLCLKRNIRLTLTLLATSILTISCYLWFYIPSMTHYRGLSGVDCGLMVLYAGMLFTEGYETQNNILQWGSSIIILGMAGKLAYEITSGATLFVSGTGARCIVEAHCIGAATALKVLLSSKVLRAASLSGHRKEKYLQGA